MKVALGHSEDVDSDDAINEALEQCAAGLDGATAKAGILFSSIDKDYDVILERIAQVHPGIQLIGATTDGEFSCIHGFTEDSLALSLIATDEVQIRAGLGRNIDDPKAAAAEAVASAREGLDGEPVLCLTTPQGLKGRGSRVAAALAEALGEVPIAGGVAADQWTFDCTHQFFNTEVVQEAVPVLLFSGPLLFSRGARSGWLPVGRRASVTQMDGVVVQKIEDMTGADFYRRYLGRDVKPNDECPLAVFEPGSSDYYLVTVSKTDEATGALTMARPIPEGSQIQLTQASTASILQAAEESVAQALERYPGDTPAGAFFFSCASRKQILGTSTRNEHACVKKLVGDTVPCLGFYGYGEIGPDHAGHGTVFHSETLVSVLVGES